MFNHFYALKQNYIYIRGLAITPFKLKIETITLQILYAYVKGKKKFKIVGQTKTRGVATVKVNIFCIVRQENQNFCCWYLK